MLTRILIGIVALIGAMGSPQASAQTVQGSSSPTAQAAEIHLGKGYDALKFDRYEEAATEFRAALASDPKLTLRARFPLAIALFELHKFAEARAELETVHREAGDHPNVSYYLGRLDLEDRNFTSAIKNLTDAAADPPFPDTPYYLGYAYAKQETWTLAEKWLLKAATVIPRDSRVQYQLAMVYRKEGREDEAKKAFALSDHLREKDSNESRIRLECGKKLDQGPREEAHALCDQLYDPDNADKLTELGTLYGGHGDLEAALKPLQRAAELSPQSPQVQYNLAYAYYELNRFEDARAPLELMIQRWPDLFQLNALYGAVLFKLGEEGSAYPVLKRAFELNPQDSGTRDILYATTLRLSAKSHDANQFSDSLRYLQEASQLKPREPGPHLLMAEVYKETGRATEAAAEAKTAGQLGSHP